MAMLVRFKCSECGLETEGMVEHLDEESVLKCQYCGSENTEIIETDSI